MATPIRTAFRKRHSHSPLEVGLLGYQPLGGRFGLKGDVSWAQKDHAYRAWGGSLALVVSFR